MIAYISGHLKITKEEFAEHYFPKIKEAIERSDEFVLCDAPGADSNRRKEKNGGAFR